MAAAETKTKTTDFDWGHLLPLPGSPYRVPVASPPSPGDHWRRWLRAGAIGLCVLLGSIVIGATVADVEHARVERQLHAGAGTAPTSVYDLAGPSSVPAPSPREQICELRTIRTGDTVDPNSSFFEVKDSLFVVGPGAHAVIQCVPSFVAGWR